MVSCRSLLQKSEQESEKARTALAMTKELQSRLDAASKAAAAAEARSHAATTALQLLRAQFAAELHRWHGAGKGGPVNASPVSARHESSADGEHPAVSAARAPDRRKRRRPAAV